MIQQAMILVPHNFHFGLIVGLGSFIEFCNLVYQLTKNKLNHRHRLII